MARGLTSAQITLHFRDHSYQITRCLSRQFLVKTEIKRHNFTKERSTQLARTKSSREIWYTVSQEKVQHQVFVISSPNTDQFSKLTDTVNRKFEIK